MFGFAKQNVTMYPDELQGVLEYQARVARAQDVDPDVESSCGPACPCTMILSAERDGSMIFAGTVENGQVL